MTEQVPRIVIIGGGFGGLAAAKALKNTPAQVVLIDRNNHHLFQPLLYQIATSVLTPGQNCLPYSAHSAQADEHDRHSRRSDRHRCQPARCFREQC
jgi:NADH dehydrogenase FAD-containing subunit